MKTTSQKEFNPYEASLSVKVESRRTQLFSSTLDLGGVCLAAAFNSITSAFSMSENAQSAAIGIYGGEFLILTTWLGWGSDSTKRRFSTIAWTGLLWMVAGWIGYGISNPKNAFDFSHEKLKIFTVLPISLLIVVLPLLHLRRYNWSFKRRDGMKYRDGSLQFLSIAIFVVAIVGSYYVDYRYGGALSDIAIGSIIGIVLCIYSLLVVPLLALALLRGRLHLWLLVPVFAITALIAYLISILIAVPGAGGAPAPILGIALTGSFATLVPLIVAFSLWRAASFRLRSPPTKSFGPKFS